MLIKNLALNNAVCCIDRPEDTSNAFYNLGKTQNSITDYNRQ